MTMEQIDLVYRMAEKYSNVIFFKKKKLKN